MAIHRGLRLVLVLGFQLLLTLTLASCLPNIRIQVNNDNYRSPPYLLEAIKQAELLTSQLASSSSPDVRGGQPSQGNNVVALVSESSPVQQPKLSTAALPLVHRESNTILNRATNRTNGEEFNYDENKAHNSYGVVKEETSEEILDLDPDAVLRLSPEGLLNGISPSDCSRISDIPRIDHVSEIVAVDASSLSDHDELSPGEGSDRKLLEVATSSELVVNKHDIQPQQQQPQLPVTNAHLKKPAIFMDDDSVMTANRTKPAQLSPVNSKSLVSPSVVSDELSVSSVDLSTKKASIPPDTWAPEQISDSANVSSMPALITKDYGFNTTRTRITLGGGYVRDRQPPLVDPSSSSFVDERPEKPVVPLEKTRPLVLPGSPATEVSRVIDVPERIVFEETPMATVIQKPATTKVTTTATNFTLGPQTWIGRPDSRCPKEGVMTLEHSTACDKYFYCEDGYISEETCPNGLMYGTRDTVEDYCVHRWMADCGDKSLPNPKSSPGCRWQYGFFSVQGSPKCSQDYYECIAGKFTVKKCPIDGQVYVDATKSCQYAERVGCTNDVLADFHCPPDDQANTYWPFPRYFLNDRALIHCVNDKPQIVRCTDEERVDPEHLHCVPLAKPMQTQSASINPPERRSRIRKKSP